MSLLDLCKAYQQIRFSDSLWLLQTMKFNGRRYCLIRLGFDLNVEPKMMNIVIGTVLSKKKTTEGSNLGIPKWHLYQWWHHIINKDTGKASPVWIGLQGPGIAREWSPGTRLRGMEEARQIGMETGNCSSRHAQCHHTANHFFPWVGSL